MGYGRVRNRSGENLWFGELSDAMDIVFDLIVDDGVPGRGHRKVIFSPEYYVVGCRIKPHASYGHVCALSFVDGFSGDDTRMKKRMKDGPPVRGEFFLKRFMMSPFRRFKSNAAGTFYDFFF